MYKLIATDMDGTLLTNKSLIPENNKDAIIKAQQKGCKFALASGRPIEAMKSFAKELKMKDYEGYIVAFNGGQIFDCKTEETIFLKGLSREDVIYFYNLAKKLGVTIVTYIDKFIYTDCINEYSKIESRITKLELKEIEDIYKLDLCAVVKCMFISSESKIKQCYDKLAKEIGDKYYLAISDPHFIEIANKDISKGVAIKKICDIININLNDVIACGDSYNDLAMLEEVGLPVAAGNSNEDIKKKCKYTAVTNEDGVLADVIDKFII